MEPTTSSDLHAEVTGTGEPAVVLIHAGIADRRIWDQQVAALARRYRVVRTTCGASVDLLTPPSTSSIMPICWQ